MKYRHIKAINKTKWVYLLIPIFIVVFSCKNYENNKQEVVALPTGKWRIIQLKNSQKLIVFDTTRTYILEHQDA